MKECKDCKSEKPLNDFNRNGKYRASYCKDCHYKRYMKWVITNRKINIKNCKKWRQENKEKWSKILRTQYKKQHKLDPHKLNSRSALQYAVTTRRVIKRNSCEICHNGPTHGHHEDYSKPLEVIWLCQNCHKSLHQQYKSQGILIK